MQPREANKKTFCRSHNQPVRSAVDLLHPLPLHRIRSNLRQRRKPSLRLRLAFLFCFPARENPRPLAYAIMCTSSPIPPSALRQIHDRRERDWCCNAHHPARSCSMPRKMSSMLLMNVVYLPEEYRQRW
uniref:Uncharacterized protein n=1 Tax=Oryza meridionalis TaxID=40149 RepID=A0A0E0DFZ8_9ORYZ